MMIPQQRPEATSTSQRVWKPNVLQDMALKFRLLLVENAIPQQRPAARLTSGDAVCSEVLPPCTPY